MAILLIWCHDSSVMAVVAAAITVERVAGARVAGAVGAVAVLAGLVLVARAAGQALGVPV